MPNMFAFNTLEETRVDDIIQYQSYLYWEEMTFNNPTELPDVFRAVLNEDIEELKRIKQREDGSLNDSDRNGNTPLHAAVIKNKLQSVNYLLAQDEVSVNVRNLVRQTPLFNAARYSKLALINRLLEERAEVNVRDCFGCTPLHKAVGFPEVVKLLIDNGAEIDIVNAGRNTPLHHAVITGNLETVCMLLYYNCDSTIINTRGRNPFMKSLIYRNLEIQRALLEYVNDFNVRSEETILTLALTYFSPYVKEIILRGAKVYYSDLEVSLLTNSYLYFKTIWNILPLEQLENSTLLESFIIALTQRNVLNFFDIIFKNSDDDRLKSVAICFSCKFKFVDFIKQCVNRRSIEQLTTITFVLLEYNCHLYLSTFFELFVYCGYCDLFKFLLYTDQIENNLPSCSNYTDSTRSVGWIIPMYIYNFKSDVKSICKLSIYKSTADKIHIDAGIRSLRFSVNKSLIELLKKYVPNDNDFLRLCDSLPQVPSLIELARETTRKYFVSKCSFTRPSQYYTFINSIDIKNIYKKIILWEQPIYNFQFG